MNMVNEREAVSSILKSNTKAFESMVKQHERLVFYVVKRLVAEQEDVADICQEVFIKVHKSLFQFKFQSKISTWIARIAYLTAINHIRKYRNKRIDTYPENIDNHYFTNENPESALTKKDNAAYINRLIEQLPLAYRTVLTLYHLNEFSCLEIAEITSIPEGTIKSNLFRARKLLKEKIQADLKNEKYESLE